MIGGGLYSASGMAQAPASSPAPLPAGLSDPPSVVSGSAPAAAEGETGMVAPLSGSSLRALVTAPQRATLAAGLAGRILEMPVRPGLPFKKGDTVVRFDCAPLEAAVNGARAALRGARADATAKERLASLQSIGQAEVEMARAAAAEAKANVEKAEIAAGYCVITAPYDGHVVDFQARPFETVQQGQPVLEIVGDSELEIEVIVPSAWLAWLRAGSGVAVHIDETGVTLKTKVLRIGAKVDPASQSVVVTAAVPNIATKSQEDATQSVRLRAGMSGTAVFEQKP